MIFLTGNQNHIRSDLPHWSKYVQNTTRGDIMLNKDFKEFIELLNKNRVKYLVVGGYAVALHGYPRYTKDLDVWIELTPENASNILKALEKFGFGSLDLKQDDFLKEDQIIQLGYPPNRIDIMTSLKDLTFKDCFDTRVKVEIEGVQINFIGLDNLKKNKRAVGRLQDLADLENLET